MDPYQTASRYECIFENEFSYFSTKTYVVGTQKGCLSETALEHPECMFKMISKQLQLYSQQQNLLNLTMVYGSAQTVLDLV